MNRKLSLGGAMLQSSKPEKATLSSKKTTYYDQNAPSRRDSTIPNPSGTVHTNNTRMWLTLFRDKKTIFIV